MNKRILIIDDDLDMCTLLSKFLCKKGYDTDAALSASKGIAKVANGFFDIVLCDFRLGDKNGKDVLVKIKELSPETIVIIITGYSDIKTAVDVIKLGAFDYITKPVVPDEVISVIEKALAKAVRVKRLLPKQFMNTASGGINRLLLWIAVYFQKNLPAVNYLDM